MQRVEEAESSAASPCTSRIARVDTARDASVFATLGLFEAVN